MEYEVIAELNGINFDPSSDLEEILQNVMTILSTPKYSVPLNRDFGISATVLDEPMPIVKARLSTEIIETVQELEPRVTVTQVTFEQDDQEGILRPKVRVRINES